MTLFVPKSVKRYSAIMLLVVQLTGCRTATIGLPIHSANQEPWHWAETHKSYPLLATMALASAEENLTRQQPADVEKYCLRYENLSQAKKLEFWGDLLSAISFYESRHNTELKYTEKLTDSTGARVISRGLLQLSFESSKSYGCTLEKAAQLHDPATNIDCGIRILSRWIHEDGVISDRTGWPQQQWKGGARYWSVLRKPSTRLSIQNLIQQQPYCQT